MALSDALSEAIHDIQDQLNHTTLRNYPQHIETVRRALVELKIVQMHLDTHPQYVLELDPADLRKAATEEIFNNK